MGITGIKQGSITAMGNKPVKGTPSGMVLEETQTAEENIPVEQLSSAPRASGKRYQILREPDQTRQTLGTFTIIEGNNIVFTCKTIELPWRNNERKVSCIPTGNYRTIRHRSPSYGECFWVQDVPGRSEILIHHGNYAASINPKTGTPDTKGCILPGEKHADVNADGIPDVTSSVNTMKKLREILPDAFELEIRTKTV
jgi:hypothetical protein